MGGTWITIAMVLTAGAGLLLATQVHPRQRNALDHPGDCRDLRTLAALTGAYGGVRVATEPGRTIMSTTQPSTPRSGAVVTRPAPAPGRRNTPLPSAESV